jgi:mannose-6-phosphate isomerase-like protein (cupin superfamily)
MVMDWHSTRTREELLMALAGQVHVEVRASLRRVRRVVLKTGQCAFLAPHTLHRVINRSTAKASYLYVTAPTR